MMTRSMANETHLLTQRRAVQQLSGDAEDVIEVPASFKIQRGEALIEGVVLGRKLGSGLQGVIYNLDFADGSSTGWVLKADAGNFTAKFMPPMLLEWVIGRSLLTALGQRKQGAEPDKLPGFMRTGSAVLVEERQQFLGQILEFVSGDGLDKILRTTEVSIFLLRRMLFEVFTALAAAQKATGFRHWDLRLSNVMQHEKGSTEEYTTDNTGFASSTGTTYGIQVDKRSPQTSFKIIDFGHGQMKGRKLSGPKGRKLPRVPFTEHCYRLFWIGRHDVFRLLMSLCNVIDGRPWLLSERDQVLLLFDLVKTITGIRLRGSFKAELSSSQAARNGTFRKSVIRVFSFWHFLGATASAEQALRHPFFTQDRPISVPQPQSVDL